MNYLKTTLILMLCLCLKPDQAKAQRNFFYSDIANDQSLSYQQRIHLIDSIFASDSIYWTDSTMGAKFYHRWRDRVSSRMDSSGTLNSYLSSLQSGYDPNNPLLTVPEAVDSGLGSIAMMNTLVHEEADWKNVGPDKLVVGGSASHPQSMASIGKVDLVWPFSSSIIYAASYSGGLFKTTDGGANWKAVPITLEKQVLNIKYTSVPPAIGVVALVVHPTNSDILYVSTANGLEYGYGIFKSIDGGVTWEQQYQTSPTASNADDIFRKIVMVSGNSNHLYAITSGRIFETTNAGANWVEVSDPNLYLRSARLTDIEIDKQNSNIVYVAGKSVWKVDMTSPTTVIEDYRLKMPALAQNGLKQILKVPNFYIGSTTTCTVIANKDLKGFRLWTGDVESYDWNNPGPASVGNKWQNFCESGKVLTGVKPDVNQIVEMSATSTGNQEFKYAWRSGMPFRLQLTDLDRPNGTKLEIVASDGTNSQTLYDSDIHTVDVDGYVEIGGQIDHMLTGNYNKLILRASATAGYTNTSNPLSLRYLRMYIPEPLASAKIDLDDSNNLYAWVSLADHGAASQSRGNFILRTTANHNSMQVLVQNHKIKYGLMGGFLVTKSPTNGDGIELYTGSVPMFKYHIDLGALNDPSKTYSTKLKDGGVGGVLHVDYRDFYLLGTTLYIAHDGGLITLDDNEPFSNGSTLTGYQSIVGKGLVVSQFWSIDRERSSHRSLIGGGVMHQGSYYKNSDQLNWQNNITFGGDGADYEIHTDWDGVSNKNLVWTIFASETGEKRTLVNNDNGIQGSTDQSSQKVLIGYNNIPSTKHNVEQAGNGDYYSSYGYNLYWSNDNGANFNLINTGNHSYSFVHTYTDANGNINTATRVIQAIAIAPSDPDVIYVAIKEPHWDDLVKNGPRLYRRIRNGGVLQWEEMPLVQENSNDDPTKYQGISDLAVSYSDPNKLWITFENSGGKKLYYSDNAAASTVGTVDYIDVSPSILADAFPVNKVVTVPKTDEELFLGTDYGIFYGKKMSSGLWDWCRYSHIDASVDWAIGGPHSNLPLGKVTDIMIDQRNKSVLASVYGRGIWETGLPCPTYDSQNSEFVSSATTWQDRKDRILHDVYVNAGGTLTLNDCDLSFAPDAKIVVEVGGKLIVNNSTLSNSCSKEWDGIWVYGNGYTSGQPNSQTGGGEVEINNSLIENGEYGVRVGTGQS
ncbi:MAG: hypothetical protein JJ975_15970, partial [Bacteroidia bacterium]|nr:hypothetical protein [Bacteroidia bacterium]